MSLDDLAGAAGKRLGEPGVQIALFTWVYRISLAVLLLGYALIVYYVSSGVLLEKGLIPLS
ncbi:MAG: hypothetical protein MAG715_00638 [Methanonatronarchaeales archaeon]|nr:hypothetical protein [Methanonatronarchaeales archaeon]